MTTSDVPAPAPDHPFAQLDRGDMVGLVRAFPDHLQHVLDQSLPDLSAVAGREVRKVAFLGMGGSGASGDYAVAWLDRHCRDLVARSIHDYDVPEWVDGETLVIATSFSGGTEETLHGIAEVQARGAPWVAITSGGALAEAARRHDAPCWLTVPGDQPRAMFGHLYGGLLRILAGLGLVDETLVLASLENARDRARELAATCDVTKDGEENPALAVAKALHGRNVLVVADESFAPVAERVRCQLNENGKVIAFTRTLPEANHNDTVAWTADTNAQTWVALWLGPFDRNPAVAERARFVRDLLLERGVQVVPLDLPEIVDPMTRQILLTYFADWVSVHLAFLGGHDPGDVSVIPEMKRRVAATGVLGAARRRLGLDG